MKYFVRLKVTVT